MQPTAIIQPLNATDSGIYRYSNLVGKIRRKGLATHKISFRYLFFYIYFRNSKIMFLSLITFQLFYLNTVQQLLPSVSKYLLFYAWPIFDSDIIYSFWGNETVNYTDSQFRPFKNLNFLNIMGPILVLYSLIILGNFSYIKFSNGNAFELKCQALTSPLTLNKVYSYNHLAQQKYSKTQYTT